MYNTHWDMLVISSFLREVVGNCALLGYYATSSGNFLSTFRENVWFLDPEDDTDRLSRNVGNGLPLLAA